MQTFRPNVAKSWTTQGGTRAYWGDWARTMRRELEYVASKGIAVRGHVAGDFMLDEEQLDRPYLAAVLWAFRHANPRPVAWIYTHAWRALGLRHRLALARAGLQVFASIHNETDGRAATAMGYRLAVDPGKTVKEGRGLPKWQTFAGLPALSCPEQMLGHEKITCSTCRYCFRPERTEAVAFYRH